MIGTQTPLILTFWMPENEYELAACGSSEPSASEAPIEAGFSKGAGVGAIKEVTPSITKFVATAVAIAVAVQ